MASKTPLNKLTKLLSGLGDKDETIDKETYKRMLTALGNALNNNNVFIPGSVDSYEGMDRQKIANIVNKTVESDDNISVLELLDAVRDEYKRKEGGKRRRTKRRRMKKKRRKVNKSKKRRKVNKSKKRKKSHSRKKRN